MSSVERSGRVSLKLLMTKRIVILTFLLISIGLLRPAMSAAEETTRNISRSSGAFAPRIAADPNGDLHAVWQDEQLGFVYSRSVDGEWGQPQAANLPFIEEQRAQDTFELVGTTYFAPHLLIDSVGNLHGFWVNDDGTLFHSQTELDEVLNWRAVVPRAFELAENVLTFDAIVGADDQLLAAYVSSDDASDGGSGLYTMSRLSTNRQFWSDVQPQYASSYYRATEPEEVHINLAQNVESGQTVLVWDDPLLERVYYRDSADNGVTWDKIQTVDSRQSGDALASPRPADMVVALSGEQIHLVWHAGHTSIDCTLYHQWSANGGASWRRNTIETDYFVCPDSKTLLTSSDGMPWLLATWQGKMHQVVWVGTRWSTVEPLVALDQFTDAERVRTVQYACRQSLVVNDVLTTIGCDEQIVDNQPVYHDIWLTQQPLDSLAFAFKEVVWQEPTNLSAEIDHLADLKLLPEGETNLHAYWSEGGDIPSEQQIRYAAYNGLGWTAPATILQSPTGQTQQPSMAFDTDGRIYAAWRGDTDGQIFVSRTESTRASSASEWKAPIALPEPNRGSSEPQIAVGADGRISIVYVIEVNEDRGVYISHSTDQGETWTQPLAIVKGANVGWERITKPNLIVSGTGRYHLTWHNETGPAGVGTRSLHYASSEGGASWGELSVITDVPATWSRQLGVGEHLYQVWRVRDEIAYRESLDDGATWSRVELVSRLTSPLRSFDVTVDASGELNVVQVTDSAEIQHLRRQNGRWQVVDRSGFNTAIFDPDRPMAIAAFKNEKLVALQVGAAADNETATAASALLFTERTLTVDPATELSWTDLLRPNVTPVPEVDPGPLVVVALPTVEPLPTASTVEFATEPTQGVALPIIGALPSSGPLLLALAVIPSLLLIGGIATIVLVRMRRNRF